MDKSIITQPVEDILQSYSQRVNELIGNPIEIPEFNKIKSREVFYESYSKVIKVHDEIARAILDIYKCGREMSDCLNELSRSSSWNFMSVVDRTEIKRVYEASKVRLNEFKEALTVYKDNLSQVLRFYGAAQYMLSSPRFEEFV